MEDEHKLRDQFALLSERKPPQHDVRLLTTGD
jgi:hypothetical protein